MAFYYSPRDTLRFHFSSLLCLLLAESSLCFALFPSPIYRCLVSLSLLLSCFPALLLSCSLTLLLCCSLLSCFPLPCLSALIVSSQALPFLRSHPAHRNSATFLSRWQASVWIAARCSQKFVFAFSATLVPAARAQWAAMSRQNTAIAVSTQI